MKCDNAHITSAYFHIDVKMRTTDGDCIATKETLFGIELPEICYGGSRLTEVYEGYLNFGYVLRTNSPNLSILHYPLNSIPL
jgi:hypothetical protein